MSPLATALDDAGGTAAPLERSAQLRALLRDELGVAPSPALQSLHRRLLGEPTMRSA